MTPDEEQARYEELKRQLRESMTDERLHEESKEATELIVKAMLAKTPDGDRLRATEEGRALIAKVTEEVYTAWERSMRRAIMPADEGESQN